MTPTENPDDKLDNLENIGVGPVDFGSFDTGSFSLDTAKGRVDKLVKPVRDFVNRADAEPTDFTGIEKSYGDILDHRTDARVKEKAKQAELDAKYEQLTDYYRVDDGTPFDAQQEEILKQGIPKWMQQRALYEAQESYGEALELEGSPVNARTKSVLDHNLLEAGDNPFEAYESHLNREEHVNAADRRLNTILPQFSGVEGLSDDESKIYAVVNLIAENEDVHPDHIYDNLGAYTQQYATMMGVKAVTAMDLHAPMKKGLDTEKTYFDNDTANYKAGMKAAINGTSLKEGVAGVTLDDREDSHSRGIFTAGHAAAVEKYGDKLTLGAKMFELYSDDKTMVTKAMENAGFDNSLAGYAKMLANPSKHAVNAVKLALGTNQKRDAEQYAMAEFLASMPREEAKTAMEAAMLIAEANSGEMDDDFVTKFSESLMRGTSKYLYSLEDAITTTSERMGFYSDEEVGQRARVRETLQDLGDIKDIHSAIVSDHKVIQGAYDMAQSAPYMIAYATGAGTTLNALAMLSEADKELRQKYPEMSRTARYKVALPTAVVNANIETLQFKSWTRGFTSFSKGLGKMTPLGVAGLFTGRGVAQLVTENLEESAQSASRVWIQHAWSLLGEDVSEVTPEDWDESLFIYDERTFFATLPLAVLGAGGRTAYDTIGAKQNEVLLSDVDRMRLFGLSKEKAEAIADQPDAMKKWLMFKDTKETFSVDERNAAIEDAMEDGVLERVLKADDEASFAEYEKDIMENGTDNQKAGVVVERTEREYREKFDAQMSEDGEGFKVTYPSVAGKPTAKFKTVEEAEQAIQEHQVETNEEFLESIGSAAKNLEAMDLHKQSLEVLHKGAEIKLGEDTVTMEEFASQSEENMAQALERIEHELYRMGVPRAATAADLKNWKANGQVHLKREMRGYIAKLGKGANIADLVEEGSEGFVRDLIENGMVSSKWLKDQIFQFQLDSGKTLTPAKSAVDMTDQQMVEAFSDLAVGNFWNAHSASKTGPMGGIINALRVFFAKVMELADQLAKLSKEGKVDADFQTLLDNSVGLNMDQQIEDNVPKFQQEIVDENDTFSLQQVNKTSANDMADSLGVARTIPEEFVGKKFLPIMADHLGIGDADGVPMQGGAGHPLLYHGTGVGWRSKRGAIAGIYGYLKKRDAIWTDEDGHEWALVAPFGMSQDAHKSNKSVFFAYIKSLENTKMSKADKLALGEYIRERADKEVNGTKKKKLNVSRMLSFPLDWTKAQLDELTHDFSHDERAYLMDGLKLAGAKHLNIPDVQTVINQLRDDSYDKVNNGSMLSLLKVDVTRLREGLKKGTENGLDASDFGVEEHLSYDTVLPADIVTHLRQPIDMEVAFPDMIKTMREISPKSAPSYLLQAKLPAAVELQTLTPELVEEINNEQAGEATPVAKAKAYINALSDKWNVIQTGKLKGAANFIAAMERNEFSETLTPINMESLKADVKSGDLSVYGLEGFDVWFGLRKREDGGKELVNVISNELSTGGMVDLIMMKAIKEGATHLDAYSVKSKKFPSGLLPTLYGRYGFKATSEDAYDKNYLGSTAKARNTKEAALKELWAKQGWDSDGQDMPSLVYMRYEPTPTTKQLRDNAQDSMVERSIEELRGETIQPSEGDGDVSGSRVDGGESGGDVGGDRGALSRRANSFLDELGSASSARLAAWNLTESERDQLVEASTPSFSIGRSEITPTADTKVVEGSNATVVGEASFSIGAWHGTPHKVDKFRTENIGTGEGAQAYGYGLYFAESRGVAESYMDKFKGEQTFRMESDGKPLGIKIFTPQDVFAARKVEELGVTKAKDFFANIISNRESLIDSGVLDNDDIGDYEDALKLVENIPTGVTNIKLVEDFDSRVYKVELNVEQEQLLDWDKPLSEQSEMVRTSVAKLADHARGIINESGEVSHLRFVDRMQMEKLEGQYTYLALDILSTRKGLSELFARFGIKGIKYLDGTSRGAGEGTYNYVMFDDADIKITEENGKAISMDEVESVSMSLTSSEDSIIDKLNAMMRDQDTRIEVYRNMSARLNKVRQRIHTNKHSSDFVTQNLAEMEAIVSVLPPELRHRAFSAKTLASKKTGEGASRYMVERLEYIDKILERFLKGEITESVVKAINQSQPLPRGGGDRGPSKIGALGHRVAAAAKEAIFMSPMEAEKAAALVVSSLDKKKEPTVEEEQMVHDVAYVYEVFADIKNADSTRLSTMLDLMQTNWEEGRSKWLGELKKRKEWKEGKVASILKGLDMVEKDDAATTKALQKGLNPIKQFARSLLSFYQLTDVLREDMGKEGKVIKEMLDDLRRAQSNFDMEQLHHKERMRAQFARIFGIKGTNKVARVQARLNSIAKGVDRGDKLTTSKMYDFNVKVWGADLDKAKAQLQVTPDAKEIVVGGIPLTRDEFDEVYEAYTLDIEAGFFDANKKNRKYSALVQRQTGERWNVGEKSQLDLANDFLAMQQADLKGKYQKTGHDEQYEKELNEALDDDVKELAMWMQNELRILTPQTEKLHTEEYGLFMATVENYFPASFEHVSKSGDTALTMDGIDVAGVSTRPSSHKMRINHHSRPVRTNAVNAFNHHIMQNAYWKTHAEVLRKWGGVMRNKDVQDGILRAKGKGFLDQLLNQFEDVETQGSKVASAQIAADRLWRGLTKGVALGVLGGRMTTVAKNMAAAFNVALGEDIGTLLKGVDPTEFKEATKELWYSDTFQRRLKMGANVATRYALEGSRSGAIIPATATRMAEMSMQLINVADTGSNMAMSLAYIAKKKELRQQNKYKEEEIKLIALDHVDDLMERYAQPTNRLSKSLMENTRHPMAQILVMFQSESRKMMAINALAIRKLATGKGAQSKGLAAQQLAVQTVLMTGFIHTISAAYDAFIKGEGEGEEEGEKFFANFTDWKRLLATMAADSLSGVPLFGELWSTTWKSIFDQKTFVSSNNPAMKPILGLQAFIKGAEQAGENSASETADKFFRSLQAMGGIMPQTAVVAQASTLAKDALGFMNNTLATGLTKADTFDVYRKKIKGVISRTGKEFEEDMDAAETLGEKRILDAERKQLILERSRVILFNIPEDERQEFLLEQAGSEKSGVIPKYIIRSYLK